MHKAPVQKKAGKTAFINPNEMNGRPHHEMRGSMQGNRDLAMAKPGKCHRPVKGHHPHAMAENANPDFPTKG